MPSSDLINTRQAAELLGVTPSTIKRWSDSGLLTHSRTAGGHRRFKRSDVAGMKTHAGDDTDQETTKAPDQELLSLLLSSDDLYAVAARLLDACVRNGSWWLAAAELGELLAHIGDEWAAGRLSVAEEHIASERLRRAIDWCGRTIPTAEKAPTCVLLTAEGDHHTMGLTLVEICAREAGWSPIWLGAQTPLEVLDSFLASRPVDLIAVSASGWSTDAAELKRQCDRLVAIAARHGAVLLLGGEGAWPEPPPVGYRLRNFDALHVLLSRRTV